ncbi:MAG TPA: hypothetical protein PK275_10270 [Chitinophagaceae bacterium]|jgi:hypothetical protein|nr:hypothetical protein [Chitinophagaceae bacterium]
MSDNPRLPENNYNSSSTRGNSGQANPPGSSQQGHYIPPPVNNPPPKVHVKNLAIGAIVTIITSTIIFLITQNLRKPEGNNFQKKKEATVETWKSFVGYENAYFRNMMSYQNPAATDGLDGFLNSIKTESEKFVKDVEDLKRRKNIDEDLIKVFNKRIENEKNSIPPVEKYYQTLTAIADSKKPLKEIKEASTNEMIRFATLTNGMYERSMNDLKEIAKVLADRYGGTFSMDEFLMVQQAPGLMQKNDSLIQFLQNIVLDSSGNIIENKNFVKQINPDLIIGKWSTDGAIVTLSKNNSVNWIETEGISATGSWKIDKDKLVIMATSKPSGEIINWRFNLTNVSVNAFTLVQDGAPYEIYQMIRSN